MVHEGLLVCTEIESGYRELAAKLHINTQSESASLRSIMMYVHRHLTSSKKIRKWLLIYDDAKTESRSFRAWPAACLTHRAE